MAETALAGALKNAIGHYMTAVAEKLLSEGTPVSSVSASGRYDDDEGREKFHDDVEGGVNFNESFVRRLLPDAEVGLHWSGTSGWCLWIMLKGRAGVSGSFYDGARWLGAGLIPEPDRVAAFLSAVQLDPHSAGSGDRPFYRQPLQGLPDLCKRLQVHKRFYYGNPSYDLRFDNARCGAYYDRAAEALTSGDDDVVTVPVRRSELAALLHLLEFAEGSSHKSVRLFADYLAGDIAQRRGELGSVHAHQRALTYAFEAKERKEKAERRRQKNDDRE
ncbi:DUF6292 family protein [Streptomyces sp. OUCMDZ-4982]|uniref:DUF6292 family protein n=1 Tax=Streptomyces sp. OUCMDZ-4982 TaxID=2973090 RepID=UPI00215B9A96|nr:DUF6292 family protein [Streptomyces sp. OUCMDZ-4982]MCR8945124.1 DUF6292 family protein [Streptomyces sp. OUCMDZ-4982]